MPTFFSHRIPQAKDVPQSVLRSLAGLPDDYSVLLGFQVGQEADLDVAIVHSDAIHTIEIKDKHGVVTGGPSDESWTVQDARSIHQFENPQRQAKRQADALKAFIRHNAKVIVPRWTSEDFYRLRVYPNICFTTWNEGNRIDNDGWVYVARDPASLIATLARRRWSRHKSTSGLRLEASEIASLASALGLRQIPLDQLLFGRPVWRPRLDKRTSPELRTREVEALEGALRANNMVALIGEPFIGKSTIAHLLGERWARDGWTVVEHDCRLDSFEIFTERFLNLLDVRPTPASAQDRTAAILDVLQSQQILLLLENLEVLAPKGSADGLAATFLERSLRQRDMSARVLLTSRISISTASGFRIQSCPVDGIDRNALTPLLAKECHLTRADADAIWSATNGNPHASFVLAARVQDYGSVNLASRETLITGGLIDVGALLLQEYGLLPDHERRLVDLAAVDPLGLTSNVFTAVAVRMKIGEAIPHLIVSLHRRGLLSITTDGVIRLLPLIREHVYFSTKDRVRLHRETYGALTDRVVGQRTLDLGEELIRIRHAVAGDLPEAAMNQLLHGLWIGLNARGAIGILADLVRIIHACPSLADVSPKVRATFLMLVFQLYTRMQEPSLAQRALDEARQLYEATADLDGLAFVALSAAERSGDLAKMRLVCDAVLEDPAGAQTDSMRHLAALKLRAQVRLRSDDDLEGARGDFIEALAVSNRLGHEPHTSAELQIGVAFAEYRLRRFESAIETAERVLQTSLNRRYDSISTEALTLLCASALHLGNLDLMFVGHRRLAELFASLIGHASGVALVLKRGGVTFSIGEHRPIPASTDELIESGLAAEGLATTAVAAAAILHRRGEAARSIELFSIGAAVARHRGMRGLESLVDWHLASLWKDTAPGEAAIAYARFLLVTWNLGHTSRFQVMGAEMLAALLGLSGDCGTAAQLEALALSMWPEPERVARHAQYVALAARLGQTHSSDEKVFDAESTIAEIATRRLVGVDDVNVETASARVRTLWCDPAPSG